jgi:hypothetical protein
VCGSAVEITSNPILQFLKHIETQRRQPQPWS